MFRGDIWDIQFPQPIGSRPCVLLTTNVVISRLGAVTVAEVTGAEGPASTHVELDPADGLAGRDRSWVDMTSLHAVARGTCRRHRGRVSGAELSRIREAVRLYLDVE